MNRVKEIIRCKRIYQHNIMGQGVGIAVLDTGICRHPDFYNRITDFKDIVNKRSGLYDDCGHGTHVSGIAAGSGEASDYLYAGMAPKSKIISVKVLDARGNGSVGDVLWGLDWIIKNGRRYNIRIINISVGMTPRKGEEGKMNSLLDAVEYAWDRGFVVVTAAGNNGPKEKTITIPGISKAVITVGSSDDGKSGDGRGRYKMHYSSRGPTPACICKPEIVTPGSNINACSNLFHKNRHYCRKSGTSMAAPVISGACALLLSRYPDMSNLEVKMRLRESACDLGLPRNQQGWGMMDVDKFVMS